MLYKYCYYLITYYQLKMQYINSAFLPGQSTCNTELTTLDKAANLHNYTENNHNFIKLMRRGCALGGNATRCHIAKSNVTDILQEFNESYYSYIKIPKTLCTPFAEFSNHLESLFITGGCYLANTTRHICYMSKQAPAGGFWC